ncbi:putative hydroxymethylpyrimidine transporter CytX [Neisseria yangbaofengii]|uniref:putative hydroxymethylpyrimidine transporter CytX n=1 Tax=Neisseria yangbaofengii TaxID=2709396 RepID=UPI0013E9C193|nr:putative hydroxymethylpyrimidine transporter CytX [Neisseria yangbaofengii]
MTSNKLSTAASSLIWFGAAVSLSEILTGTFLAPLGWERGVQAVILGHIIGCALFFCAALIGAQTGKSAMETVQRSFGIRGSVLFSSANVLQLIGWTAIMIYTGAQIAAALSDSLWGFGSQTVWGIVIGLMIVGWLYRGGSDVGLLKKISLGLMLLVTVWLSVRVFGNSGGMQPVEGQISFGLAVELSAVMPLSWLPLVADYTRRAAKPKAATIAAALAYFVTSTWMYLLGLGAVLFLQESDIAKIFLMAGIGIGGVLVVILSTVTTTYLDAYSAGVSSKTIFGKANEIHVGAVVAVIGALLAVTLPVTRFESFLLMIGSVFAPMVAILIADYFVLKHDASQHEFDFVGLGLWLAGFLLYRNFLTGETPLGITFPVMAVIFAVTIIVRKLIDVRVGVTAE